MTRGTRLTALFMGLFLALSMVAVDHAEARRGGSFGSRGTRTFQSAPATQTAPTPAAPVQRSMTPGTAQQPGAAARPNGVQNAARPGFMNGMGGTLMRGLLIGGLFGLLLGQGFGGLAGLLGLLVQGLLIGLLVMLAIRFFRSRSQQNKTAYAGAGAGARTGGASPDWQRNAARDQADQGQRSFNIPAIGGGKAAGAAAASVQTREIQLDQSDLNTFEQRLGEVQTAFGQENYSALRRLLTPEMVSYFSEELAQNASSGVRNEVSDVTLLQADIAESWNEGDQDYATAALRYESRDRLVDRQTGKLVEGSDELSETTELWTFTRRRGEDWKLSAIQEA